MTIVGMVAIMQATIATMMAAYQGFLVEPSIHLSLEKRVLKRNLILAQSPDDFFSFCCVGLTVVAFIFLFAIVVS